MRNIVILLVLLLVGIVAIGETAEAGAKKGPVNATKTTTVAGFPFQVPLRWLRNVVFGLAAFYIYAAVRWPWQTLILSVVIGGGAVVLIRVKWQDYRRRETVLRPLAGALSDVLHVEPETYRRWLKVPRNLEDDDAEVRILLPPRWHGEEWEREAIRGLVSRRLPGVWEARWNWPQFMVTFRHPPPPPGLVEFNPAISTQESVIPIGQGSRGEWVNLDLDGETPHVLISAPTGWGKTSTLSVLIAHVVKFGGIVDICDPKRVGFMEAFDNVPGIRIHTYPEAMVRAVRQFREEMSQRYALHEAGTDITDREKFPRRLLVLDEMGSLISMFRSEWRKQGGKNQPEVLEDYMYILWQGRFARHNVAVGAQQANAQVLVNSDARDQFGAKIAAGPQSVSSWRMMFGNVPLRSTSRRKGSAVIGRGDELVSFQLSRIGASAARALALASREPVAVEAASVQVPALEAALPADMPSSVQGRDEQDPLVVGIAAGAEIVGLSPAAFVKARQRAPIDGERREGNKPAWTRDVLLSWQSRRPVSGGRTV